MKNRLLSLAGGLALFAVLGKFYALPAIADSLHAALVKNIDERGRNPYSQELNCTFSNGACLMTAPPVPASTRLVLEHVNLFVSVPPGIDYTGTYISNTARTFAFWLPTPQAMPFLSYFSYMSNESVLHYFEAGESPIAYASSNARSSGSASVSLTGYLVKLDE